MYASGPFSPKPFSHEKPISRWFIWVLGDIIFENERNELSRVVHHQFIRGEILERDPPMCLFLKRGFNIETSL